MIKVLGKEVDIDIGEKTYRLSRFTLDIAQEFIDYARSRLPDPVALAVKAAKDLPAEIAKAVINHALDKAARILSFSDPEVVQLMESPEGALWIWRRLLKAHHGNLTKEDCADLFTQLIKEHGENVFIDIVQKTQGGFPTIQGKEEDEKKAPSGSGVTSITTSLPSAA